MPHCVLLVGMAGSGKTTLMHRLTSEVHKRSRKAFVMNLDPAVTSIPYGANIDIRDTVKYKEVMKQYQLGPNGAIITSLNLFATRFDQVLGILDKRAPSLDFVLVDTPGQIEAFTWSASGQVVTDALAATMPTCVVFVVDTPRAARPATFISNMLYACSIMYKTRLPLVIALNKTDVVDASFALDWIHDFEAFQQAIEAEDATYLTSLTRSMGLMLDEFYQTMTGVGLSAITGDGMDELFAALDEAQSQYQKDYGQMLAQRASERAEKEAKRQADELAQLSKDTHVVLNLQESQEDDLTVNPWAVPVDADRPDQEESGDSEDAEDDSEDRKAYEDFVQTLMMERGGGKGKGKA